MNKSQSRHAKAMARKIKTHAESVAISMGAIDREDLSDVPLSTITALFTREMEGHIRNMRDVVTDMLPELADK